MRVLSPDGLTFGLVAFEGPDRYATWDRAVDVLLDSVSYVVQSTGALPAGDREARRYAHGEWGSRPQQGERDERADHERRQHEQPDEHLAGPIIRR